MTAVLSYGGGVNSTALALLLKEKGEQFEMIFADTGAEYPETLAYVKYFEKAAWIRIQVVRVGQVENVDCSQRGLIDYCNHHRILPFRRPRWCTEKFKIRPLHECLDEWDATLQYVGFDAGEPQRAENLKQTYCEVRFPLIEEGIDRKACVEIIKSHGLDVPKKSGCYICPFQRGAQWKELFHNHLKLWNEAVELEQRVREKRGSRHSFFDYGKTLLDLKNDWAMADRQLNFFSTPCECYDG